MNRAIAFTLKVLLLTVPFLIPGPALAQEGVEVRAAKVCGGIAQQGTTFQGALKIDNLTVQADGNGTVTLKRDGVDLGKIERLTFKEYTECLIQVIKLISPRSENGAPHPTQAFREYARNGGHPPAAPERINSRQAPGTGSSVRRSAKIQVARQA